MKSILFLLFTLVTFNVNAHESDIENISLASNSAIISYITGKHFKETFSHQGYTDLDLNLEALILGLLDTENGHALRIPMIQYFKSIQREKQK